VSPDPGAGVRLRVPLDLSVTRLMTDAGHQLESSGVSRHVVQLFDTADRRLAAAGAELSFTRRDGWCWRRDTLGNAKLAARQWVAPADSPPGLVADWSRAYRRGRPLAARATVCVYRRTHHVLAPRSAEPVTLVEERIDELVRERWTPRLRRLTVPQGSDGERVRQVLASVLGDRLGGDVPVLALLRPALVRAPRLRLPDVQATSPRDLFARSVTLSVIQWLYFDCELTSAGSADALRKLRVAMRRLRSDLQTFAPLLDGEWADQLRERLGGLAARLGTVRDAEVLNERLAELASLLPAEETASALPLIDIAAAQLSTARAQLLDDLARDDYLEILDSVISAVAQPRWSDGPPVESVAALASRPWRRLRRFVAELPEVPTDAELHRIRILAKRVRYAADACIPAVGEAAQASSARIAALQTVLGDHHDASVTREWLHRQSEAAADVAFPAGQLAAFELGRMRHAGTRWREAWVAASRPKEWRWLRG
jgi:CHAD domain-containing protein